MTKRNDKSIWYKDWTTGKLKREAQYFHGIIYGGYAGYGCKDIQAYDDILNELDKRGIEFSTKPVFIRR